MAYATQEELDELDTSNQTHEAKIMTEDEIKSKVQELNDLMDPSKLTKTQQHCIAQIVACFVANHIHRYYHAHKYVAIMNNKLNNDIPDNDQINNDELHLIYPIPTFNRIPSDKEDINNTKHPPSLTMLSIIKKPDYYCSMTSTDTIWAKSFLKSFCEYLKVPQTQIMGYLYFIEQPFIDPGPFFETLGWNVKKKPTDDNLLRIPLLLLQHTISHSGYYDSRLRSLLKSVVSYCNIDWQNEFIIREYSFGIVLHVLLQKKEAKSSTRKWGRWAKIGAVGVLGGTLIAVTGGLAAPAVAAGLGAIGLTATGTFLLTTTGTATVYLLFGVTGAGYAGLKMHNKVKEVSDFRFISIANCVSFEKQDIQHNGLNVIIGINGWLEGVETDEDDVSDDIDSIINIVENDSERKNDDHDESDDIGNENRMYWKNVLIQNGNVHLRSDCYTLEFETKCLLSLGSGLKKFVAKKALSGTISTGAKATLTYTALGALLTALTWPVALLAVADYIDNPWSVAFEKSKEAGLVLADCLASGNHGRRPVTLIGWSLGARTIYYALKELVKRYKMEQENIKEEKSDDENGNIVYRFNKKRKKRKNEKNKTDKIDLCGIIENVIIIGAPCSCESNIWTQIRKMVSDRIISCYSSNDWVLKFVYRTATVTTSVAGLMPIECDGIENIDLSHLIDGHSQYYDKTPQIIKYLIDFCGLYL